MRKIISIIGLVGICSIAAAQVDIDSARAELYRINKVFDSSLFLGFDVHIVYSSDTIYGRYAYEEMDGSYILNQRNIYYRMGNTEYVQNDSFVYNIYHDEKMLMMTKDPIDSKSSLFPVRSFVDSVLTWYDTAYTISLDTFYVSGTDTLDYRVLTFDAMYDSLPYNHVAIYYAPESYYPYRVDMKYFDGGDESDTVFLISDTTIAQPFLTQRVARHLSISFLNYYNPTSLAVFQDSNYVYFNRQSRRYKPVDKFRGYRFIANGVEGDEYDDTIEIYPPPANE